MNIILISLLYVCMSTNAQTNTNYECYLQAHNAYAQKEYADAVNLLKQLPHDNFPVLYNLGWSYLKNNELYAALYSFKKALLYSYGKNYVQTSMLCKHIQGDLGITFNNIRCSSWYLFFNAYIPTLFLQCLFLIIFLFFCYLFFVRYYKQKKWFICCIALLNCVVGVMLYDRFYVESCRFVLIKNDMSCLYSGPDNWYTAVCRIPQGSDGRVVSCDGEWYCIVCGEYVGWIKMVNVDIIQ